MEKEYITGRHDLRCRYLESDVADVLVSLAKISPSAKIYRTFVTGRGSCDYVFVTTHKDTYLLLGQLDFQGQQSLGRRLMIKLRKTPELLLFLGSDEKGILVTPGPSVESQQSSWSAMTFYLSPAH